MILKSITMQGFKSCPEKTVLEFNKGITGVVGPNGSGKSNISDAVRWVLGEQSTKSLRGSKMEDVIFNGTDNRKASGFADVTLCLDNRDRTLQNDSDEVTISSGNGFSLTEIPGLEIKNTTNSSNLHEKLTTYLPANGSSINELNTFIKNNVKENGAGTREGVVTAAVSLINYLYDGFGVSLPYYWGGQYQYVGVNPSFGGITSPSTTPGGYVYNYSGFDCSGFASWAIKNGGYNFARHTTSKFHAAFAGNSCNIADSNCIGQPGDLINSESCHVQMIVSVDEESGKYYVAESTGSYGLIMRPWNMHTSNCGNKETRILHMDSFYNNQANVDTNY